MSTNNNWHKPFLWWFWGLFIGGIVAVFLIFWLIVQGALGYLPPLEELQNPKNTFASEVFTSDQQSLGRYYRYENRVGVQYTDLSPELIHALVATEDARFYNHTGVDFKSMFRAILKLGRAGGGSTLTQQLAKQLWSPRANNIFERAMQKPIEWVIATKLERLYSKDEILLMYLNQFDFLYNAVGIQSASQVYFSTTPGELKLEEAAMLVGMCKNPSLYNPVRHPVRATNRRNTVLSQMAKYGYIDEQTRDSVSALPLTLHYRSVDHKQGVAPYFREYLRLTMTAKEPSASNTYARMQWENNPLYGFCEKNKKPDGSKYDIYKDGLRIYTTIDSRMQRYAEEAVQEHMKDLQKEFNREMKNKRNAPYSNPSKKQIENGASFDMQKVMRANMRDTDRFRQMRNNGVPEDSIFKSFEVPTEMQVFSYNGILDTVMTPYDSIRWQKSFLRCGFMSMDPFTGHVKAYVGGPDFTHFQYDMVTKGRRQIGSTVKPYLFTLAMSEGMWPCDTVPYDSVTFILPTDTTWTPRESHVITAYKDGPKLDYISLTQGLQESSNWVSAFLMSLFTPEQLVKLMKSFGIQSQLDPVVSLCVGPCEVSVEEMTAGYTTFANKGIRTEPLYVTHIEDRNGNVIASFTAPKHEIISETTSYKMTHMLRAVVDHGTGVRTRFRYGLKMPLGAKTGTSNENADGWFMCFTPTLVSGAWVGGDEPRIHFDRMQYGQGAASALPICAIYLKKVYADKELGYSEEEQFDIPEWFDPNAGCK